MQNRTYNTRTKRVNGVHVCIYCGKIVYGYRTNDYNSETYYNCMCEGAKAELSMEKEIKTVQKKYRHKMRYNRKAIDETADYLRSMCQKQKPE